VAEVEQSVVEEAPSPAATIERERQLASLEAGAGAAAERAARETLRRQIARLEHELSSTLAERFPFLAKPQGVGVAKVGAGPCLPDLAELERSRDRLAAQVQELRALTRRRNEHERQARELLERMRLEPGHYKYVRLPVSDLGEGGCGVWEVRPRLGLIGMLAGWWQLTLSSGCPLELGSRERAAPPRGKQHRRQRPSLSLGHRADGLLL
jgi:hypothetical protein